MAQLSLPDDEIELPKSGQHVGNARHVDHKPKDNISKNSKEQDEMTIPVATPSNRMNGNCSPDSGRSSEGSSPEPQSPEPSIPEPDLPIQNGDAQGPSHTPMLLIRLSSERQNSKIRDSIVKTLESEKHCDIDIICGVKSYALHRAVLAANSGRFKTLLTKECSKWNIRPQVKIDGIPNDIFEAVIDFFYFPSELSDPIREFKLPKLSQLLQVAKTLEAKGLVYRINQLLVERVAARESSHHKKNSSPRKRNPSPEKKPAPDDKSSEFVAPVSTESSADVMTPVIKRLLSDDTTETNCNIPQQPPKKRGRPFKSK